MGVEVRKIGNIFISLYVVVCNMMIKEVIIDILDIVFVNLGVDGKL